MPNRARILIIEDDISIPVLLEHWLQKHADRRVLLDHAKTVEDGLARAEGAKCILLDLTLGHWRPPETLQLIPELRKIAPVIVLSGYSEGSDEADAEFASNTIAELGADMVFFKPNLMTTDGVGWLFTAVAAAIGRRLYEAKAKVDSELPAG